MLVMSVNKIKWINMFIKYSDINNLHLAVPLLLNVPQSSFNIIELATCAKENPWNRQLPAFKIPHLRIISIIESPLSAPLPMPIRPASSIIALFRDKHIVEKKIPHRLHGAFLANGIELLRTRACGSAFRNEMDTRDPFPIATEAHDMDAAWSRLGAREKVTRTRENQTQKVSDYMWRLYRVLIGIGGVRAGRAGVCVMYRWRTTGKSLSSVSSAAGITLE